MTRLPIPGSDDGTWGSILNEFLSHAHNADGSLKDTGIVAQKYLKPATGIPEGDLSGAVQAKLNPASLRDTGGNIVIATAAAASPVNYLTAGNAAAGSHPVLTASGTDTNIDIHMHAKGTGAIRTDAPVFIENSQNSLDMAVENNTFDATLNVITSGLDKAAYINLFATSDEYGAISGWVNNDLKWRIGRFNNNAGASIFTNDGVSEAVHFDDTQNTRLRGGLWLKRTAVIDTNYTIAINDHIVAITSLTAPRTITLPTAVGIAGQVYSIKDESGQAATYAITIATTGGQTIDGAATQTISTSYGGLTVYSNGAQWFVRR